MLDAIAHVGPLGLPVVLSDGDMVFQPRKIQRSGIWNAVQGRVLIDVHKERALANAVFLLRKHDDRPTFGGFVG